MMNLSIFEMRRTFDHVNGIYNQLRVKALAFIAGLVAIVTFLFASDLKFPGIMYGQIIFIFALVCLGLTFGLLLWTVAAVAWKIPCDHQNFEDLKKKYKSRFELTKYIHDDYVQVLEYCIPLVSNKAKRFNLTIYLFSVGVIIVLLIKYGGPQ